MVCFCAESHALCVADVQLPAGRPGVLWTEGAVLPALQTLYHGVCGRSGHD